MTHNEYAITATVVTLSPDLELEVLDAEITMDSGWLPFVQATLKCKIPSEAYLAVLDPRYYLRVEMFVTNGVYGRTFDLLMRSRSVDHAAGTVTLGLASDDSLAATAGELTTVTSYLEYQGSIRALVDTALALRGLGALESDADEVDGDLTVFADQTNLVTNPSFETGTASWTAVDCTMATTPGASGATGSDVLRLTTPTDENNYAYHVVSVTPGETYVFSASFVVAGTPTGTPNSRARRIVITDTVGTSLAQSAQGSTSGGSMERLTGEVTIPSGVSSVWIRLYGGYPTTEDIRWDAVKFAVKSEVLDDVYFDGATTDTADYAYTWSGTAHASASNRTDITGYGRTVEMFDWNPGTSTYDFLEPMLQAAGARLFCDENRLWHLVDPLAYSRPGLVVLDKSVNVKEAADDVDIDSGDWFDAVVTRYRWVDKRLREHVQFDFAGSGALRTVGFFDYNRPYPGPGAAQGLLDRALTRGRMMTVTALMDIRAEPGVDLEVTLPSTPTQYGEVASVTWRIPANEMTVKARNLTEEAP